MSEIGNNGPPDLEDGHLSGVRIRYCSWIRLAGMTIEM